MDKSKIKNIAILGSGESGIGAAILAKKQHYNIFVSDSGSIKEEFRNELINNEIAFEEEAHDINRILKADLIIKSPGIPEKSAIIEILRIEKKLIVSEIEFASWFTKATIIGITGSNGKTTTTMLTYHILKNAGLDVAAGGNTGVSFARLISERDYKYIVLEISSFQLDDIIDFKCHIAILLNITPDHLDRYHYNMEEYAASKFRITENQSVNDYFIYNQDDEFTMKYFHHKKTNAVELPISQNKTLERGVFIQGEEISIILSEQLKVNIKMNILSLVGKHNRYNSMAASTAAFAIDIKDEDIRQSLSSFENIEHRLEFVAKIQGKEFINDSKATNINAVWYALESMIKPVVWIVGGIDKGNDYSELYDLVKEKVVAIVCLGVDNKKITDAFDGITDSIFETASMTEAVELSYKLAEPGNIILLSPACASFDLFKNYEDRGNQFKDAVRNL